MKERLRRIATFPASKSLSESNRKNLLSPFEEEKISLILAEVSKAREIYAIPPTIARIYLSSACYHNCSGCSFAHSQIGDKVFLSSDHFRKLIDDLPSMNIKLIDLTGGGEPTLHPQFIDFVKMCMKQKFQLALLSNGTWNDPRLIDILADGFSFIRVNLDASSGEVYDQIHRPPFRGEFQRMMNNLEKTISEREKRKSGLIIGAKVRLNQVNMNYVEGMITLAKDLGLDYIQFQINQNDLEALLPEQRKNVNEILNELKYPHHSQSIYGEFEEKETGDRCWASNLQLTIDSSGDVYSCPHFLDQTDASHLGNFLNQTMHDLWLGYDHKRRLKPTSMKACPVENCRWRFYDDVIRERNKTK
ncbi:MAG: radical SAM protein [Candidatus Zixiibacteriota bacterium]